MIVAIPTDCINAAQDSWGVRQRHADRALQLASGEDGEEHVVLRAQP
jgi:hypothetical protein